MKLITLSGVDGSGKSTQLDLLTTHLEETGSKVAYFHAVEFSCVNRLVRMFHGDREYTPGKERAVVRASWISLCLRKIFLIIDLMRFRILLSGLRRQKYDYLLSDRYFYDSLVNIEYLSSKSWDYGVFLQKLLIKPDVALFLDLSPEIIMTRERVPEQGIEYLKKKQMLFRERTATWDMSVIDANRPKEELFITILNTLKQKL